MANKTLPAKQQTNLAEVGQQGSLSLFFILHFSFFIFHFHLGHRPHRHAL
jgi:hypothetical protein